MLGVVACETLYPEFDRVSEQVTVEYVPQWYHEFPIHAPESERIRVHLQKGIERLENRGVDEILILYHDPEGVTGLRTAETPLHVFEGGDCIELFLDDSPKGRFGERKALATYYLSRGWIDVGIDCYKVYKAYAGEIDEVIDRYESAQSKYPDMRVTWPESERIVDATARSKTMRVAPESLLEDIVSCYHRVLLIDTGTLTPFHHEYAETFREFVSDVGAVDGERKNVFLRVIEGNASAFNQLLRDPYALEDVRTYAPGVAVSEPPVNPFHPPAESD